MGAEELESDTFRPLWEELVPNLSGKSVALFGSYGWGDGEWMRLWESEANEAGIELAQPALILHETPDQAGIDECHSLGENLSL